jgi:hypothetical protein
MMAERGIALAHTTILCWVQQYVPDFEKRYEAVRLAGGRFLARGKNVTSRCVANGSTCTVRWIANRQRNSSLRKLGRRCWPHGICKAPRPTKAYLSTLPVDGGYSLL